MQDEDPEQTDERLFFFAETSAAIEPKPNDKNKKVNPNAGHRDRLRERFAKAGKDGVADYELLEMLLYRSLPRIDTKPIAKDLLLRFGSFGDVLSADIQRLEEVKGIKHSTALDLKIVAAAAKEMLKSGVQSRELLSSWASVLEYCTAAMAYESKEQFRILFLDKKNGLIADEVQQTGTIDHTPVYPREVLKRAIELSATAIILVHNHPSGDPTPSNADVDMTKKIIEAIKPLGIVVHDHIIIGKSGHASLKGLQLI